MTTAWLDANVVLRFLTKEPVSLAQRANRLFAKAHAGEIALRLTPVVVAEIAWALRSIYGRRPAEIAAGLSALLRADGILVEERDELLEALELMVQANVSFPDAFLAISARQADEPVCTFDADFKRLAVEILAS